MRQPCAVMLPTVLTGSAPTAEMQGEDSAIAADLIEGV